jgi:MFS family permease
VNATGQTALRQYSLITINYWAFTLTDGALRMLIVLYFYQLGYDALAIAWLFLFYEFFGVVTNLVGGWLGARIGLNRTMNLGLLCQAIALGALLVPDAWLTLGWVMAAQALSGIAKDLNKMSAKAGLKSLVPAGQNARLFKWVAALTGSKNTLKGVGFFLGGFLLWSVGFWWAIASLLMIILAAGCASALLLQSDLGKSRARARFSQVFASSAPLNWLSLARLCLFAARDVWFVVALPISLASHYGWSHSRVGAFFALWIIGYGVVQGLTPQLLANVQGPTDGRRAFFAAIPLFASMLLLLGLYATSDLSANGLTLLLGLFGLFFAINSSIHSYLIVAWARADGASLDVGFYYMSNAMGRLIGTVLSGFLYVSYGLTACLLAATVLLAAVILISVQLKYWPAAS